MREKYFPHEPGEITPKDKEILLQVLSANWRASEYTREHFGIIPVNEQIGIEADWLAASFRGLKDMEKGYHFWQKTWRKLKSGEKAITARLKYLNKAWVDEDTKMRVSKGARWEDLNNILIRSGTGKVDGHNLTKPNFNIYYSGLRTPPYFQGRTADRSKIGIFGNLAILEPVAFYRATNMFGLEIKERACGKYEDRFSQQPYTYYCMIAFHDNWALSIGIAFKERGYAEIPVEEKFWSGSLLPEAIAFGEKNDDYFEPGGSS